MEYKKAEIRYPVGIQSFPKIISEGYLYVDKTPYIHRLIKEGGPYFLARPRRFGKSLLLSTIESYYLGQRDLFKGLALDTLTDNWEPRPVFNLDFNSAKYTSTKDLDDVLENQLDVWEKQYGYHDSSRPAYIRFGNLIRNACQATGKRVVILIDEYDKPILNCLESEKVSNDMRDTLKAVFGNLKSMDQYIEFAVLTGVARFSKISIFSDLNNLRDISFEEKFAAICGITEKEIDDYFNAGIDEMAAKLQMSCEDLRKTLRLNYDGYHFSEYSEGLYNPFSLMSAFSKNAIGNYWFEGGTPTHLIKQLRRKHYSLKALDNFYIDAYVLASAGHSSPNPVPTLYQTGYLTIKGYDQEFKQYILGYPNEEVRQSFMKMLLPLYIHEEEADTDFDIRNFLMEIREGGINEFMERLKAMIASVPYADKGPAPEAHFQNVIYLIFSLMGFYTEMEKRISNDRIDLKVATPEYIYIFEFKIDSTAEAAMAQIKEKRCWSLDSVSDKKVILIGANFDSKTRRLDDYKVDCVE